MAIEVTFTVPALLLVILTADAAGQVTDASALTVMAMLVGTVTLKADASAVRATGVVPVPPAVVIFAAMTGAVIFNIMQNRTAAIMRRLLALVQKISFLKMYL